MMANYQELHRRSERMLNYNGKLQYEFHHSKSALAKAAYCHTDVGLGFEKTSQAEVEGM